MNVRFGGSYTKHHYRVIVSWSGGVFVAGINTGHVGTPKLLKQEIVAPSAIPSTINFGKPTIADGKAYVGFYQYLAVSWLGKERYRPTAHTLTGSWSDKISFFASGVDSLSVGTPSLIQHQFIAPPSIHELILGTPYALHDWQYAPVWHTLNVSWLGKEPSKNPLPNAFYVAWFIPSVHKKSIGGLGFDVSDVGTPSIVNHNAYIKPNGFFHEKIGVADIGNKARAVATKPIYPPNLGMPTVINSTQTIKTGNLISTVEFGKHAIKLALQFVAPKGIEHKDYGVAWASHFLRHITHHGNDSLNVGKHRISHHTQFIRPMGVYGDKGKDFASNHAIGGTQIIAPIGTEMTEWLTRIIPENQVIGIEKGINGESGTPAIVNHTQYLNAKGFGNNDGSAEMVRFGHANIFNLTQQITQYFIADSGLVPQVIDPDDPNSQSDFGRWTAIVNRNKTIATFGVDSSRFGYQQIQNKAVPVLPVPIMSEVGKPMIAYRVRTLAFDGIEPPHFSYWHIIRNTARVLKPSGFDSSDYGKPSIASNKQFVKQIFPFENSDIGTPMIADRVRTIDIEWRYSIAPPTIALPTIENHTRYIVPKGFDGTNGYKRKFGRAELMERFNIIRTHGRTHDEFGSEVIIRNLTPELRAFGHNSNEFGETAIRNEWREIYPVGNQMSGMGKPIIKDRKQTIRIDGFNAGVIPIHHVQRMGAPPYTPQTIDLNKYHIITKKPLGIGFGIELPKRQVPPPNFLKNNIETISDSDMSVFGRATITANTVHIHSGIALLGVGEPVVWIKQQFIKPNGIDEYIDDKKMGKPQLSPYTIYAPSGDMATAQARRNHVHRPDSKPIDSMEFGQTVITNQHRTIFQSFATLAMSQYGRPSVENSIRYIRTTGFRGGYFGWHSIPFVPQTITQYSDDEHKTAFGVHQIGFLPKDEIDTIYPKSIIGEFGEVSISNFHRNIHPKSFSATQMGKPDGTGNPFMWQGLRIGERVLGNYGGFDSSTFGQAWISNKIREVRADGFDSFVSESDIKSFKGRLTVKRATDGLPKQRKPAQVVGAVGINPNAIHNPNIKNKAHYIRPDGNAEQFRKGAW